MTESKGQWTIIWFLLAVGGMLKFASGFTDNCSKLETTEALFHLILGESNQLCGALEDSLPSNVESNHFMKTWWMSWLNGFVYRHIERNYDNNERTFWRKLKILKDIRCCQVKIFHFSEKRLHFSLTDCLWKNFSSQELSTFINFHFLVNLLPDQTC